MLVSSSCVVGRYYAKFLAVLGDLVCGNLKLAAAALVQAGHETFSAEGDAERLLREGFDGYLEKPIRYKEFLASVAALLAGKND